MLIAHKSEENNMSASKVEWQFTQSSPDTPLVIALNDGRLKYLEDPTAPSADAIKEFSSDPDNVGVILMPPCSAETINDLAKTFPAMTRAIIIDHYPARLNGWKKLIEPNVNVKGSTLLLDKNIAPDKHKLVQLMDESPLQYYLGKFKLYFPRRHKRVEADFSEYLSILTNTLIDNMKLKLRFQAQESWHQALNALYNVKNKSVKKYKFKAKHPQLPYVIAGAGPSLDGNIEVLKKHKDKVIIIACERALGTFEHHELKPDYIACVENIHGMMRHFTKHHDFVEGVPLIAPYGVTHIVADNYNGPIIFTNSGTDNAWLEPINDFKTDAGFCVGHYGFHIAEALNPSKIVLIGSDLSYKDGKSHTSHTFSDGVAKNTISTQGYYGGTVETSGTFKNYIDMFIGMIRECNVPTINATEGGALIPGAEHTPLEQAIADLPEIPDHNIYDQIPDSKVNSFYSGLIKTLKKTKKELIESKKAFGKLNKNEPMHFFGFIPRGIQVLFNQYINSKVMLNYHEIRTNYKPQRFDSFNKAIEELWDEMYAACEFMLAIDKTADYSGGDKNNCLAFVSEGQNISWLKVKYPRLNITEMPALQPLPEIWKVIRENNIGRLIAFERNVIPDAWTLPNIDCIDIKEKVTTRLHPVKNYSIAVGCDEKLKEWNENFEGSTVLTTGVPFAHIDEYFGC